MSHATSKFLVSPLQRVGATEDLQFYQFDTNGSALELYQNLKENSKSAGSFILQSSEKLTPQSRFDFLGEGEVFEGDWAAFENFFSEIKTVPAINELQGIPLMGGYLIQLNYDAVYQFEPKLNDPLKVKKQNIFKAIKIQSLMVFDHIQNKKYLIEAINKPGHAGRHLSSIWDSLFTTYSQDTHNYPQTYPQPGDVNFAIAATKKEYLSRYSQIKDYIVAGDIFQCNYSIEFLEKGIKDPFIIYKKLREINPSPFAAYVDWQNPLISCSPERLFKVDSHRRIETRPIAGTRPVTGRQDEDFAHQKDLILSDKEQAEHLMLIDLERNDLGRICEIGSVKVDEKMTVEKYSHVQHLVSNISGQLRQKVNLPQIFKALFPGGTITGVPKIRCMQIIAEMEKKPRGAYCGALGYVDVRGNMDFNILIRTMEAQELKKGDYQISFRAGSGIVADSDGEQEYLECLQKAKVLAKALGIDQLELFIR